ncbi:hypothetical protein SPV3_ORF18 [Sulfolobus polyhedral virus 3]|nr:hypothetical protein SPV3_ORF18 [Sulfolobus polyhedral virus 3]
MFESETMKNLESFLEETSQERVRLSLNPGDSLLVVFSEYLGEVERSSRDGSKYKRMRFLVKVLNKPELRGLDVEIELPMSLLLTLRNGLARSVCAKVSKSKFIDVVFFENEVCAKYNGEKNG